MDKTKIIIQHKIYYVKIYLEKDSVTFELESETDSNTYINHFTLENLKNIDKYFKQSETIQESLNEFKDLLEEDCDIEQNNENENILFVIHLKKRDIKLPLLKIDDNVNISYDSLSDYMKELIDDNRLVIGIDLGTTYSCAAVMIDNNIIMIRNSLGLTTTPSYVSFINRNKVYVGQLAKLLPSNEKNVIYNAKRLLGKNINDKEIIELSKSLPFKLKNDEKFNLLKILLYFNDVTEQEEKEGKKKEEEFYPEQISSLVLKKIIKDSEFYLSQKIGRNIVIKDAVITVPAYFNQKQREATLNSAKIMGLNVKTMINEPTAASLAYAHNSKENTDKYIVVIDFGGGTLDITLLEFTKNKDSITCNVKFAYGNSYFGGEDFDNALMDFCIAKFTKKSENESTINSIKDLKRPRTIRLKRACERAKIRLSSFPQTKIHLENYSDYESIDIPITRNEFFDCCGRLFEYFEQILDDFILQSKNKIKGKSISEVILIGGSTLIPKIKEIITKKFDKSIIKCDLNPKEVVAMGASIRGAKYYNLPSVKDIKLFDVTNLSLGIMVTENKFSKLIERSTAIPFWNEKSYETSEDNQTSVLIAVYEGEDEDECDKNNLLLGQFMIKGLPKKKAGDITFIVKLKVEENSIMEVTATYKQNDQPVVKKSIIERPKELLNIMDQLKERFNKIELYENEEYNKLKIKIINLEDELRLQKSKKNINKKNIESLSKNIIEIIGNFLTPPDPEKEESKDKNKNEFDINSIIDNDELSSLYISFIKYYFNKVCEFYKAFNIKNIDEIPIIKISIKGIFNKIEVKHSSIIFEIMEEFIDLDNIYKSFKDFILKNYWEKINAIIYLTKSIIKDKKSSHYDKALIELSEAKRIANVCKELYNKFMKNGSSIAEITLKDLDYILLKIEVREEIIKVKKKHFIKKLFFTEDPEKFQKLYKKYSDCPFMDKDDLNELAKIIGFDEGQKIVPKKNYEENFAQIFDKASKFLQWLEHKKPDKQDTIFTTIHNILSEYPYPYKNKKDDVWNDYYYYKSNPHLLEKYLNKIKGEYQEMSYSNILNDIEFDVYNAILAYINKILNAINKW